jgi:UPF0716 protein FxsA
VALLLGVVFFIVPFAEMIVVMALGPRIGWDTTVTLMILFSAAGAWLVKREGFDAWRRVRTGLDVGRMPTADVVDGVLVLFAGALLLCPGFVTDICGLLLILPPVRSRARMWAGDAIAARVRRRIRTVGSRLGSDPIARETAAHRAYRRPAPDDVDLRSGASGTRPGGRVGQDRVSPNGAGPVWGARVRDEAEVELDVIDVDGEELIFGQGELGPSGF